MIVQIIFEVEVEVWVRSMDLFCVFVLFRFGYGI